MSWTIAGQEHKTAPESQYWLFKQHAPVNNASYESHAILHQNRGRSRVFVKKIPDIFRFRRNILNEMQGTTTRQLNSIISIDLTRSVHQSFQQRSENSSFVLFPPRKSVKCKWNIWGKTIHISDFEYKILRSIYSNCECKANRKTEIFIPDCRCPGKPATQMAGVAGHKPIPPSQAVN